MPLSQISLVVHILVRRHQSTKHLVKYLIRVHHGNLLQSLDRNLLKLNEQVLWNEILLIYKSQWKLNSTWLRMASKTDLRDT